MRQDAYLICPPIRKLRVYNDILTSGKIRNRYFFLVRKTKTTVVYVYKLFFRNNLGASSNKIKDHVGFQQTRLRVNW